jgi:GNAT superfamily N-acetyltransferase
VAATLVIRSCVDGDRDVAHRLLSAQLVEHALPAEAQSIRHGIDLALAPGSSAWLWLAELDGTAVAIFLGNENVSVERGGTVLWVEELYVVPAARRRGVARALLMRAREEALRRGFRGIDLEVVPSQTGALALYRALGFEELHRLRRTLRL